jgi:hypothetical protein
LSIVENQTQVDFKFVEAFVYVLFETFEALVCCDNVFEDEADLVAGLIVQYFQACKTHLDGVESLVDGIEAFVDAVETFVNAVESADKLLKRGVDAIESFFGHLRHPLSADDDSTIVCIALRIAIRWPSRFAPVS